MEFCVQQLHKSMSQELVLVIVIVAKSSISEDFNAFLSISYPYTCLKGRNKAVQSLCTGNINGSRLACISGSSCIFWENA